MEWFIIASMWVLGATFVCYFVHAAEQLRKVRVENNDPRSE